MTYQPRCEADHLWDRWQHITPAEFTERKYRLADLDLHRWCQLYLAVTRIHPTRQDDG